MTADYAGRVTFEDCEYVQVYDLDVSYLVSQDSMTEESEINNESANTLNEFQSGQMGCCCVMRNIQTSIHHETATQLLHTRGKTEGPKSGQTSKQHDCTSYCTTK